MQFCWKDVHDCLSTQRLAQRIYQFYGTMSNIQMSMAQLWAEAHVTFRSQNIFDELIHAFHLFLIVVVKRMVETIQFMVFDIGANTFVCRYDVK